MAEGQINLKILVDKKKSRVLFAESGADFVNALLSFLTLPMGTISRLGNKESEIGCIDALYQSVETMDTQYLCTEACKAMLLNPRMELNSETQCRNLVYPYDNENKYYYTCRHWNCTSKIHCLISMFKNAKCHCGKEMSARISFPQLVPGQVFVEGTKRFIITDDLHVTSVSSMNILSLLRQHGADDKAVQERNLSVSRNKVLQLLKRCFASNTPMTDVFLRMPRERMSRLVPVITEPFDMKFESQGHSLNINLKLLISKSNKRVLYAEAKDDFVDLLFSFLTFPLGSIIKLFSGCSSMGSVDNLYNSVEPLLNEGNTVLENCNDLVLSPKVFLHYGIKNQLFEIEEGNPGCAVLTTCLPCFRENEGRCKHGLEDTSLRFINPKFVDTRTESGGGYVKRSTMFMITDDLVVKPLSAFSAISLISRLGLALSDVDERIVSVGKYEALLLLRASLTTSKNILSHVFCQ